MHEEWRERFRRRDRLALARLISRAARGDSMREVLHDLDPAAHSAKVAAITGSAGVGKSTLVGKLLEAVRTENRTVAVLACDPQSPISGGALLGDRYRMPSEPDEGVYIRSLSSPGGHGAVAEHLDVMIDLLERFGFDLILIETVGAGQGETAVRSLADCVVLLVQPETGDDLQWEKAGVLEIADVIGINKADLPGADHLESQVRNMLGLSGNSNAPIVRISGKTGEGISRLWETIRDFPARRGLQPRSDADLLKAASDRLAVDLKNAVRHGDGNIVRLLDDWRRRRIHQDAAVDRLLALLGKPREPVAK